MCIFQSRKATQYSEVQCLMRIPNQQLSNVSDFGGTIALCNLLVRLLLKQQAQKPSNCAKQMVNNYEDIIQPPERFIDTYKPIPPPRTGKWESVKPKPVSGKSVKQMVKEYEDTIQPPEQFRDGYKPIPKPRTDRPLQMRGNQNARRSPKPQRSPPPPPKREHEEPHLR